MYKRQGVNRVHLEKGDEINALAGLEQVVQLYPGAGHSRSRYSKGSDFFIRESVGGYSRARGFIAHQEIIRELELYLRVTGSGAIDVYKRQDLTQRLHCIYFCASCQSAGL